MWTPAARAPRCTSGGATGTAAHSTPNQVIAGSVFGEDVAADITGLTGGQGYCFRVVAVNSTDTATSPTEDFTAGAPTAQTGDVLVTNATTATVSGQVNPSGQTTTYHVDY